ncbi:hypothetical protein BpHYR1_043828 [Brachionus plicatilis]|uniref:Uncharacterized protein n=1 Tax=Brachionus plicatilis TaxID=10195 RepID=A0A3M7RWK3_BRAPC|nr:hypothetical protein BpHYR1_043828 [Brachionus plicatilis]
MELKIKNGTKPAYSSIINLLRPSENLYLVFAYFDTKRELMTKSDLENHSSLFNNLETSLFSKINQTNKPRTFIRDDYN